MIRYLYIIAALAASVFFFSSCQKDDEGMSYEQLLKQGQEYLAANAQREGVITTPSGLQFEVLREGNENGKSPTVNDMVRCKYQGTFIDGKVFDSTYPTGNAIDFPLSGVIPGWTEGLQYMKEGAQYRFVIPYQLAYGPSGYATIPPYSTLIFEVELLEVL